MLTIIFGMKRNTEFETECIDLSDQGYGVCRYREEIVFVPDLLVGEKARVRIVYPSSRFSIGKVVTRYTSSPERTEERCPAASRCGGCMLQHMKYEDQLKWKTRWMKRLFDGRQVADTLGATEFFYRNKAQFPVNVKEDKIEAGFYRPHSHDIVDTNVCCIQQERINEIYLWIKRHLKPAVAKELRHILIRHSEKTGQSQVVFIGRENRFRPLARKLAVEFDDVTSIVFNENSRDDNVILGEKYEVLYGSDSIMEDCLGLKICLHFKSFFQVNPKMMEILYAKALELAQLKDTDQVVDLYSGTGTIGLLAARQAGHVTGVEIVAEAVENAGHNASINHIQNAEFVCQDATEFANQYKQEGKKADVLFVDPPRKGLTEQGIMDIAAIAPERIVYVSCNPHTLKRDLERFEKVGYKAGMIQPVDLFPQTPNVEVVCLLSRKDK